MESHSSSVASQLYMEKVFGTMLQDSELCVRVFLQNQSIKTVSQLMRPGHFFHAVKRTFLKLNNGPELQPCARS